MTEKKRLDNLIDYVNGQIKFYRQQLEDAEDLRQELELRRSDLMTPEERHESIMKFMESLPK